MLVLPKVTTFAPIFQRKTRGPCHPCHPWPLLSTRLPQVVSNGTDSLWSNQQQEVDTEDLDSMET